MSGMSRSAALRVGLSWRPRAALRAPWMFVSPSDGAFLTAEAAAPVFPLLAWTRALLPGPDGRREEHEAELRLRDFSLLDRAREHLLGHLHARAGRGDVAEGLVEAPLGMMMFLSIEPLVSKTKPTLREKIRRP